MRLSILLSTMLILLSTACGSSKKSTQPATASNSENTTKPALQQVERQQVPAAPVRQKVQYDK